MKKLLTLLIACSVLTHSTTQAVIDVNKARDIYQKINSTVTYHYTNDTCGKNGLVFTNYSPGDNTLKDAKNDLKNNIDNLLKDNKNYMATILSVMSNRIPAKNLDAKSLLSSLNTTLTNARNLRDKLKNITDDAACKLESYINSTLIPDLSASVAFTDSALK